MLMANAVVGLWILPRLQPPMCLNQLTMNSGKLTTR